MRGEQKGKVGWITEKDKEKRVGGKRAGKVMVEKRGWNSREMARVEREMARRGMQIDNKPSSRPPSTYGISPVTPVLLVYAACISGASHQERNVRGDFCSRRNLEDLGLVLSCSSLFTPLPGLKRSLPSPQVVHSFPPIANVGEFS